MKRFPRRIIVIGFMGAGKTTIARALARRLGMRFRDCDALIEKKRGKSVRRIFEEEGEGRFRKMESAMLKDLLKEKDIVLSTGGGIVLDRANRERIRKGGFVVWVKAPLSLIGKRVRQNQNRPLLNVSDPGRMIKGLLNERVKHYRSLADTVVYNHGGPLEKKVSRLIRNCGWDRGDSSPDD